MEDLALFTNDIPWEKVGADAHGMSRKVLRRGPDDSPRAALLRLPAGFEMDAHSHSRAENHYVLEGMYEAQGREFPAGTYRYIQRHAQHGPYRSHGGALLLVVWEE